MIRSLLGCLRLVRFPLVFTAIADSWAFYLLTRAGWPVDGRMMVSLAVCSAALLCFGMAFNDLLDFRKDLVVNPRRPIPAGQISTAEAAIVVILCLAVAGVTGFLNRPYLCLGAGIVAVLIALYDGLAKRWPFIGLVLLGLIRFHHAALAHGAWGGAFIWQPLWLMNHVVLISVIAYRLEEKQPPLSRVGGVVLACLWLAPNVAALGIAGWQAHGTLGLPPIPWRQLLWPAAASCAFVTIAAVILFDRCFKTDHARAGWLMRVGLPWLIVYDAAFVAGTDLWPWAIVLGGMAGLFVLSSWAIGALERKAAST